MKAYLKLILRHKWILVFLPVLIGFCVLGFSSSYYCNLYSGDYDTIHQYIIPNFHLIVSMMSIWWTILFFSGFISEQGNELIFLCFKTNRVLGCQLFLEALYVLGFSIFYFTVRGSYQLPVNLLYLLAAESFLMNGLAFLLIQLTRNTSLALGVVAVYCVFLIKFDQMEVLGKISVFPNLQDFMQAPIRWLFIDIGVAFLCHVIGGLCFQKRKAYF